MSTPAGWYPDPDNGAQQRYWDGENWTDNYAPAAPQPQSAQFSGATPPKTGISTGAKVALGIIGGILLLGGCAAIFGIGDESTSTTAEPAPPQSAEEEAAEDVASPSPKPTSAPTYQARISGTEIVNPATIRFDAVVKRPAGQSDDNDTPLTCTVKFSDASGNYKGFDFYDVDILAYSSRRLFGGNITITNEGAVWVTQQSIECQPR